MGRMQLSSYDLFQSVGRKAKLLWDKHKALALAAVVLCLLAAFLESLNGKEDAFFSVASFALAAIFGVLKSVVLLADRIGALAYAPIGIVETLQRLVCTAYRHLLDQTLLPDSDPVRKALLPQPLAPANYSLV
ncbi:hypothetical protein [Ferribacterium limneticum]|uniref:hypothetical protein n=1 Tax=Ferribacterium limneticum TaxID=76259 RepID=UPI001CFAFCE4|nr:hypothetical protein [Ferribacterium limneticum]UCV20063.1 hypothetical protein KI610_05710 [Ferribacterium limneticum]